MFVLCIYTIQLVNKVVCVVESSGITMILSKKARLYAVTQLEPRIIYTLW